jgi:exodeoxyribonuclease VII small subunit
MANKFDFNQGLVELEEIVKTMEKGDLALEDSLDFFARGVALTKQCQQALAQAEQQVMQLSEQDNYSAESTFNHEL